MSRADSIDDEFRLTLGLFALGALSGDEHRAMKAHIAQCRRCHTEYDEFQVVVAGLSLLSDEDIGGSVVE